VLRGKRDVRRADPFANFIPRHGQTQAGSKHQQTDITQTRHKRNPKASVGL